MMYVSFLAGCFRSVRFGLEETHEKDKHCSSTGFVRKKPLSCFMKIHILLIFPREILTIQAKADKEAAGLLLQKYSVMTDDRTTTSCSGKFGEYLVISRPSP